MYFQSYLLALVKLFVFFAGIPLLAGFVAGLIRPSLKKIRVTSVGVGVYVALEIASWIDKGRPLLFANLTRLIAMYPPEPISVAAGVVGGVFYLVTCVQLARYGVSLAGALRGRRMLGGNET